MKIAVLYTTSSGNTKRIAEEISEALDMEEVFLQDISIDNSVPEADFYFIGFGVKNGNCPVEVCDVLDQLYDVHYALFITCGLIPTEKYKDKIMEKMEVWMPEEAFFTDAYFCQGKTNIKVQNEMMDKKPCLREKFQMMFDNGESHPDDNDAEKARSFAQRIIYEWC